MELLTAAINALREGVISPVTFGAVVLFGLVVWGAAKFGEKVLGSVGGLIEAGEEVRAGLAAQLRDSDQRAAQFQRAADEARVRLGLVEADLATLNLRHEALTTRANRLAEDLQQAIMEAQDLRARLARASNPGDAP